MKDVAKIGMVALCLLLIHFSETPAQLLNNPESVEYDALGDRYLVSNWGDGSIVQIDEYGFQSYFDTTLTRIAGLHVKDNVLYVAANLNPYVGVYGYDLYTDEMVFSVEIPSVGLLNDVTTDTSGYLYVTDFYDHKMFKVDIANQTYSLFVNTILSMPNGVVFDAPNNRLLVISETAAGMPIHAVNLEDSTVTVAVYTNINSVDGLSYDNEHLLYFSSWYTDVVYRYDAALTNPAEVFSTGHNDPADIFVNKQDNILCVPNFYWNTIDFVQIDPSGVSNENTIPAKFTLYPSHPNPFNGSTMISYNITEPAQVMIDIFDALGRKVESISDGVRPAGDHHVTWSANDQPSGIYYYTININGYSETEKMTLIK
jgi:sugar lactone lactonase YvrE